MSERPAWLSRIASTKGEALAKHIEIRRFQGALNRNKRHKIVSRLSVEKKLGPVAIFWEMVRIVKAKGEGWENCVDADGVVWSPSVIRRDLEVMQKVWERQVGRTVEEHRARVVQELAEVKKDAWEDRDRKSVISAIDREIEVLGLAKPAQVEVKHGIMDEWARKLEEAKQKVAARDGIKVMVTPVIETPVGVNEAMPHKTSRLIDVEVSKENGADSGNA